MKTDSKQKIIEYIARCNKVKAHELIQEFGMSRVGMHKHLRELVSKGFIQRVGITPHVFYIPASKLDVEALLQDKKIKKFIEKKYLYISESGEVVHGYDGLRRWIQDITEGKTGSSSMLR